MKTAITMSAPAPDIRAVSGNCAFVLFWASLTDKMEFTCNFLSTTSSILSLSSKNYLNLLLFVCMNVFLKENILKYAFEWMTEKQRFF